MAFMKWAYWLILLCFLGANCVYAQEWKLAVIPADSAAVQAAGIIPEKFQDLQEARAYLQKLVPVMQEEGYLAASIDSVEYGENQIKAYVYAGRQYRWAKLSFSGIPAALWGDMGIAEQEWNDKKLSPKRLAALTGKILSYSENNGYPFATVFLDDVQVKEEGVEARLQLDLGNPIAIDTIVIESSMELYAPFLYAYLGIHPGDPYNEKQLRSIRKKIADLPYLQESQPWKMEFTIGENALYLYLEPKKANQINGLIGLQPNTVETGKLMLTADVLLNLKNALSYGESIGLLFQQMQYKSPRFQLNTDWPYLLGTQFGLDGDFELFKRDTTFYRTTLNAGVRYLINASDYLRLFYRQNSNRVFSPDLNYVKANQALPADMDVAGNGLGMEYLFSRTDYRLNPRKGIEAKVSVAGMQRSIRTNDAITGLDDGSGFDYASLYDTLPMKSYQYQLSAEAAWYKPLWKTVILKLAYHGGYVSGNNLFLNELFQIGGFKLLRGFDEQSLYVNQYHIATVELRLLLNRNSYFYIFNDDGYTITRYNSIDRKDIPIGLGAGITLETKTGIFSIAFALGKHDGEAMQFRQTKIHFGYVAYF